MEKKIQASKLSPKSTRFLLPSFRKTFAQICPSKAVFASAKYMLQVRVKVGNGIPSEKEDLAKMKEA